MRRDHENFVNLSIAWRDQSTYRELSSLGRQAFAWEWLRRSPSYWAAWLGDPNTVAARSRATEFGLVAMVDPVNSAAVARPVWEAAVDRSVLVADVLDADAPPLEGLDLLAIASLVTLEVDANEDQHLLLSDGKLSIRIDIVSGTVLGGPALLAYRLWGVVRLKTPVLTLRRLISLISTGRFASGLFPPERMAARWILELRVADALADGASHRDIAQSLFRSFGQGSKWRSDGESLRLRVQRLTRIARRRIRHGAHLEFLNRQ